MESLKVPATARRNSCSSICRNRWKARIGGTVDSPTPMVPICSDSTRVISSRSRNWCASAHAATQPVVPPPAMTTLRILPVSNAFPLMRAGATGSTVEFADQHRADLARQRVVHGPQHVARRCRQVLAGAFAGPKDVVVEDLTPGLLFALRAVADRPQRVLQREHRRRNVR